MTYHYCRVSTRDQNLDRQIRALSDYKKADKVFADKASGKNFDRAQYQAMKSAVVRGDEVIIKELDRLGRNKDEIKEELKWFRDAGVTVRILDVPTTMIDFQGQDWVQDMINNILIEVLGAIAQREREKTRDRQREGIDAKKARGDWDDYGRPRKNIEASTLNEMQRRVTSGEATVIECCRELGICKATWYNIMRRTTNSTN